MKRTILISLKPRQYMMLIADKQCKMIGSATLCQEIIKKYYDSLTESEQRKLVAIYEAKTNNNTKT